MEKIKSNWPTLFFSPLHGSAAASSEPPFVFNPLVLYLFFPLGVAANQTRIRPSKYRICQGPVHRSNTGYNLPIQTLNGLAPSSKFRPRPTSSSVYLLASTNFCVPWSFSRAKIPYQQIQPTSKPSPNGCDSSTN